MSNQLLTWQTPDSNEMGEFLARQIRGCSQLDILTGYFFMDGIQVVQEALQANSEIKLRILVGMDAGIDTRELVYQVYEYEARHSQSNAEAEWTSLLKEYLNHYDSRKVSESQARLWTQYAEMIRDGRLEIRKTRHPNHSKLYLFYHKDQTLSYTVGSSNLSYSGLSGRHEMNYHVEDGAADEAKRIFDALWQDAQPIIDFTDQKGTAEVPRILTKETPASTIRPFDAVMRVMREYLQMNRSDVSLESRIRDLLRSVNFREYQYQIDAVSRAKKILDVNRGVMIADVVGLGKSVMASLLARLTDGPGVILAPPHLIGGAKGWQSYLEKFKLDEMGWRAFSLYEPSLSQNSDVLNAKTVIIDEAHNLRNARTKIYSNIQNAIRDKSIIALSATPFNNRPDDLRSLIDFFPGPKIAGEGKSDFLGRIDEIIKAYHQLTDERRTIQRMANTPQKAKELRENTEEIQAQTQKLRTLISPLLIRRNRLDLINNERYEKEVGALIPELHKPINKKAELTQKQSEFYDAILNQYFSGESPAFQGAMYRPKNYVGRRSGKDQDEQRQENLYSMICRFIVSRWESSPKAFQRTLANLQKNLETAIEVFEKYGVFYYGLDDDKLGEDDENIDSNISVSESGALLEQLKKAKSTVYLLTSQVREFVQALPNLKYESFPDKHKAEFLADLKADHKTLQEVAEKFRECGLEDAKNDGKLRALQETLAEILTGEFEGERSDPLNPRKVIIFTCFADTAEYIRENLEKNDLFRGKILYADGPTMQKLDADFKAELEKHFRASADASSSSKKTEKMILVCTDVLSEGIDLNQGGVVINYDVTYNPVRVIQRLGRINRISQKVFDTIYHVNFFPTGPNKDQEDINRVADISVRKMKSIHSILGEDAQILSEEEEPRQFLESLDPETEEKESLSDESRIADLYRRGLEIARGKPENKSKSESEKRIRDYEAELDKLGLRWSHLEGREEDNNQLYLFQRNIAAFYVKKIPNIDDDNQEAVSVSCYDAFNDLFERVTANPSGESLPFCAEPSDPLWGAYRKLKDKNGYVPKDAALSRSQKKMRDAALDRLQKCASQDKKFLRDWVYSDINIVRQILMMGNPLEEVPLLIQEIKQKENNKPSDYAEDAMIIGITKEIK